MTGAAARIDDIDTTISYGKVKEFSIARNDPETAKSGDLDQHALPPGGMGARLETRIRMRCRRDHFLFRSPTSMPSRAACARERCFSRSFTHKIPRDNL